MMKRSIAHLCVMCAAGFANAQPPDFFGPPGGRGPGGPGLREETKLVAMFDKNGDRRLNSAERKAAREYLATQPRAMGPMGRGGPGGRTAFGPGGPPRFGPGGPPSFGPPGFGRGANTEPPKPGSKLTPSQVKTFSTEPLYDLGILRTLFLEFENPDWEKELADFYNTDVEVPANVTVDGKTYRDVGVHFRGMTSFMGVPEGRKRSLNLAIDFVHNDQRLGGYRTLNLLNSNADPTFLRTVLYLHIARQYIPAPEANYVRVAINGESWGVYVNVEQFNTDFVKEWLGTTGGARWKVPGSPGGRGGLNYLGEDPAAYKRFYEIKSKDDPKSWDHLIRLSKVLSETPVDQLEKALEPILDVDGALKFLALEKALINSDGYWARASDYNLYQDTNGRFHLVPHDVNETLREPEMMPGLGGRGRGFGPGGPGQVSADLDPFAGSDDPNKPLLNRLLAVPTLRARYLAYMRSMAETWLDWKKIAPLAGQWQAMIAADVAGDTRKLDSTEAFTRALTQDTQGPGFGPLPRMSLKSFIEKRREYLLKSTAVSVTPQPR
jgi:hypothetical protein